jgi:hypothetical protein
MAVTKPWLGLPGCFFTPLLILIFVYPFREFVDHKWGTLQAVGESKTLITAWCIECKSEFRAEQLISHNGCYYCGKCKPILLQKLAEGSIQSAPTHPKNALRTWWFWACILLIVLAAWEFYVNYLFL